jgi:alkylation response protein AidB-like acyl-CoA dehydrogenase
MNFDLTPDQKMIADTAQSFARKESPVSRFRALRADPLGYSRDVWKHMGELGWLAILLPESLGGFGGSFVDASLVLEQFGTTLVPEPFVPSVVLAGTAIARAGSEAQQERWLGSLAAGDVSLAFAHAERAGRYDALHHATRAVRKGDVYELSGEKVFVANGHAADALVVVARTAGNVGDRAGVSLFLVDPKTPGIGVRPVPFMDGQRGAVVTLERVEVGRDALLGEEGASAGLVEEILDLGAAAACAEGYGIIRTCLEMTREYLTTRQQFGVKIGTFQALQHRCVDMFVEAELAKSTAILAAIQAQNPDAAERMTAISTAKAQLSFSGKFVTQQAIQLHGGIGVTDEHDIGLYFKRMHVLNSVFGDEEHHLERLARLPSFTEGTDA